MKQEREDNNNGNNVVLKFSSNICDVKYKNVDTISRMFEDNVFTESKLKGFQKLIGLEGMDNIYLYILAKVLSSETPQDDFCCNDFIVSPIIIDRALSDLYQKKILEKVSVDRGMNETFLKWYRLSNKVWDALVENGTLADLELESGNSCLETKPFKNKYLIYKEDIQTVELYYNDVLNNSLNKVKNILEEDNLKNVRNRILEENQHSGICISFYGPSGTGKTEKVLQLAKSVNRDVYNYKIADSESRYCGEKQDVINKMFEEFNKLCKNYKKKNLPEPILLLNEADALFSKRHEETTENNTANRENNQLQAELLNHIENFDGIMIITTNQIENFDNAMERRFLFKLKFDNPDKETQKAIWKNRFPTLSKSDLSSLVDKYDFTGGNIQNIKKKSTIEYIISGSKVNINLLLDLCKDEKIEVESSRRIGFGI